MEWVVEEAWIAVPLKMSSFLRLETGWMLSFREPILILYEPANVSMLKLPEALSSKYSDPTPEA